MATEEEVVTFAVSCDVSMVEFARLAIGRLLPPLEPDERALFYIAVTEVVTNAIQANLRDGIDDEVHIDVVLGPDARVVVRDSGSGFDGGPTDSGTGLGLVIAQGVVPELEISSTPHGSTVIIPFPGEVG